jgi:membrane protein DedA with SNARE-associated domain
LDTIVRYGLVAVFVALMLAPFGLPIPEDVSLLAAGILAAKGHGTYGLALVVGYVGVVGGDIISWTFGSRVGLQPRGFVARLIGPDDIARIERFYLRYGAWAIVIARQFPGMRLPAFFFAGASGISLPRFLAYDGAAAVVTTGVFVSLGYAFADDLAAIIAFMDEFRWFAGLVVMGLLGLAGWRILRRQIRVASGAERGVDDEPTAPPAADGGPDDERDPAA